MAHVKSCLFITPPSHGHAADGWVTLQGIFACPAEWTLALLNQSEPQPINHRLWSALSAELLRTYNAYSDNEADIKLLPSNANNRVTGYAFL